MIEAIFSALGRVLELILSYNDRRQEKLRLKEANNETKDLIARGLRRERARLLKERARHDAPKPAG